MLRVMEDEGRERTLRKDGENEEDREREKERILTRPGREVEKKVEIRKRNTE